MRTFFQPVELPKRCFLAEILYWIAFQRLPQDAYLDDGTAVRDNFEMGYRAESGPSELSEDETRFAGIPDDPHWRRLFSSVWPMASEHYEEGLKDDDLDPRLRARWLEEYQAALLFEKECRDWQPHFERATELGRSKIYVALREGRLAAKGRLLPSADAQEAIALLQEEGRELADIEPTIIPPSFWELKTIDFEASASANHSEHYCHISCLTEDVIRVFPGDRKPVAGVERVGETLILDGQAPLQTPVRSRGRPPFPWESFHIEVADLFRRGQMPSKKEAAIEHFRDWFKREHGVHPSRAAVGEKLKPYFDKLVVNARQKI